MNNHSAPPPGPVSKQDLDGWSWSLTCPPETAFLISDLLSEITDPEATAVAIDEKTPETFCVTAYYPTQPDGDELAHTLRSIAIFKSLLAEVVIVPIPKTNWVANSQANLTPVRAGRFIVHGSHDRDRIKPLTRLAIEIDAAEAFGTAHHGTTKSCLRALDVFLALENARRILDLGTGSGVLAIAAAKAEPEAKITATDIDPIATRTARRNRDLNGVKKQVKILTCPGFENATLRNSPPFDLIIANILTGPLKKLSPQFRRHLLPGGTLILSGILQSQAGSVRAVFRAQGFVDCVEIIDGEWSTLTMRLERDQF